MKNNKELHCCKGCGRDTRGDYCPRCIGSTSGNTCMNLGLHNRRGPDVPLEDDYSEESNADSVCEDNSASLSRVL